MSGSQRSVSPTDTMTSRNRQESSAGSFSNQSVTKHPEPVSPNEGYPTGQKESRQPITGTQELPGEGTTFLRLNTSSKQHSRRGLKDLWAWELLSILASLSCLVAITVVLAVINGKALAWWTLPIRPNAMIAVFSAVAKATFLLPVTETISQLKWLHLSRGPRPLIDLQRFDDASRGPWGSFVFLWKPSITPTVMLASLGCLITISALAVDPFTQQIISYPSRPITLSLSVSTPVADAYDSSNPYNNSFNSEAIDDQMQGAIAAGVFNLTDQTASLFNCPAENCTWPAYDTLGVCGTCRNVTALSSRKCSNVEAGLTEPQKACAYTTPANNTITANTIYAGSMAYYYTMLNSTAPAMDVPETVSEAKIALVDILRVQPHQVIGSPDAADVQSCVLHWCIRTYAPLTTPSQNPVPRVVGQRLLLRDKSRQGNSSKYYNLFLGTDDQHKYTLNYMDMLNAAQTLQNLFTTSMNSGIAVDEVFSIGRTLYKSDNYSAMFDAIATSMTNRLRVGRNVTRVAGQAWGSETYIHVDWAWFALPVGLLGLAAVLLLVSIVVNRREGGRLWKSSVLACLFCRLDGAGGQGWELDGRASQMDDVAGGMKTVLEKEGGFRAGVRV